MLRDQCGLAVFDLDGTLLRGKTVCELLAEPLGRSDTMREFEQLTSEKDIAASRIEMASWYSRVSREELLRPLRTVTFAPGAQVGIRRLQSCGIFVAIASITWQFAVEFIAENLGVLRCIGTELGPAGEIQHLWPRDKARWLLRLASELKIESHRVAAVGDSVGDAEMLAAARYGFFVGQDPPSSAHDVMHLPGASIATVAEAIVERLNDSGHSGQT